MKMFFKTWLETQIPFQDFKTIKNNIIEWCHKILDETKNPNITHEVHQLLNRIHDFPDVFTRDEIMAKNMFFEIVSFIEHVTSELDENGLQKLADTGNSIRDSLRIRLNAKQKDTFRLKTNSGVSLSPSDVNVIRSKDKDINKKGDLIKLYNWANNTLSKFPDAHGLIDHLSKDIYDQHTWGIIMDFAEENGMKVNNVRHMLSKIFDEQPTTKDGMKGWH